MADLVALLRLPMPKPYLPTLEDVAAEAKVSTATVSRCLNTPERVADSTRARILQTVADLGYTPNFGAKALASRRTNTIGAIIPTMANAIFARALEALQETLAPAKATLLLASSYYDPEIEEQQIRAMIARGADGLLLIGKDRSEKVYEFLEQRKIPFVIAWTHSDNSKYSCVGFDNVAAAEELTALAIRLGHREFAIIAASQENNDRSRDRVTGIKRALANADLPFSKNSVFHAPYSITAAGKAFQDLIKAKPETTVVICGNDVQAVGVIKMAQSMGIDVPGDLSVTGFDNLEITTVIEPAITTVQVPHKEMGQKAAEVLLQTMNSGSDAKRIKLPTHIIERDSLSAPK